MRKRGRIAMLAGCFFLRGLLSFCFASANPDRPILPAEASFIKGAGQALVVTLHLKSGRQLLAMVDTGSKNTILDESLISELGKPLGSASVTYPGIRKTRAGVYRGELYLGDVQLLTAGRVRTAERGGVAILGMDCLQHYCIQLDFAAGRIRFLDPDNLRTEDLGHPFRISISPWTGYVSLREDFMGLKGTKWLVDTGACGVDGLLNPKLFKLALQEQRVYAAPMGMNGAGTRGAIFPEGAFGSESYTNLVFGEVRSDIWQGAPNVLGLRFLARHLVTFNFPKRVMYLRRRSVEEGGR